MLLEELQLELKHIDESITQLKYAASTYPEGSLRVSTIRGEARYYRYQGKDLGYSYLPHSSRELAEQLAQKEYERRILTELNKRRKALELLLACYEDDTTKKLYAELSPARQSLVVPFDLTDEEFAKEWENQPFEAKQAEEQEVPYKTSRGELVRSKSEAIIANTLLNSGIPYKYEAALEVPGLGTIYPDFTVLNKRTRKEMYWEHLGMMDDDGYRMRALRRIEAYQLAGISLGKSLIVTVEGQRLPFDTRTIESNIWNYLR